MSESYVTFLDSTGATIKFATNQETVGGNTVHAYKSVLGGMWLPCYWVPIVTGISTATANSHLLEIMAGGTLDVLILKILLDQMAAAGSSTQDEIQLVRLSSAGTGGTAVTPRPADSADSASGATAMTLPSAKGTEGVVLSSDAVSLLSSPAVAGRMPAFDWNADWATEKPIRIPAGTSNGLAIKNVTAVASATIVGRVLIAETDYRP